MKKILTIVLVATLASCSSNEEKLVSKLENHLVNSLKDPSSYEAIESKLDTVYVADAYKQQIKTLNAILELQESTLKILNPNDEYVAYNDYAIQIKTTKNRISQTNQELAKAGNDIREIVCTFKYRAKNGFGALDIHTQKVVYNPNSDVITF